MTSPITTFTDLPRSAAIETSGRHGSVALGIGPNIVAEATLSASLRHAVELMPALERLCAEQGWMVPAANGSPALAIEQVYLSLGPGSFTGLRIAVAMARAMAQAIGCRLVGVPSLDVIAENAPAEWRVVVPILDAKRGQVFAARYERAANGGLVCAAGPALVDPAAFLDQAAQRAQGERVAVLGEGVEFHRATLLSLGAHRVAELDRSLWAGRAAVVHRLGWRKAALAEFSDPATLLPIYIRLPEAEEVWRKTHGVSGEVSAG